MSEKFKGEIKSYSMNYKKERLYENKNNNISKTVVAGIPTLKKVDVENIKINDPFKKSKNKKNKGLYIDALLPSKVLLYRVLFGCAVLLLSIIGCVIYLSVSSNVDESIETKVMPSGNFSNFLSSVVMHDPEPFSSPEKADKQMVISSGIWRSIIQNGSRKYDNFDEKGCALVPFEDVFNSCRELFGENYNLNKSETVYGSFYTFAANDDYFHVSAISNQNSFLPYIEDSKEEKDNLILKVGYLSRSDDYFKSGADKAPEPTPIKHMKYILKKSSVGNYYIYAIENSS